MTPEKRQRAPADGPTPNKSTVAPSQAPVLELVESAQEWFEEATDLASQLSDYRGLVVGPVIPMAPSTIDPGVLGWYRTVRPDHRPDSPTARIYYLIAPMLAEAGRQKGPSPIHDVDWVEFVWTELVGGPSAGWILVWGAPRDSVTVHFARAVANQIAEDSD